MSTPDRSRAVATEHRVVQSLDPSLSPRANELLTRELRRVTGTPEVDVPASEPHYERRRHGGHRALIVTLMDNRLFLGMLAVLAIILGVVIAFVTSSWWVVGIAAALDLGGILIVVWLVFQLANEVEGLPPEIAALLEDEGVEDPDLVFTQLVKEYEGK